MEDLQSTLNHLWDAGFAGDRTDARVHSMHGNDRLERRGARRMVRKWKV